MAAPLQHCALAIGVPAVSHITDRLLSLTSLTTILPSACWPCVALLLLPLSPKHLKPRLEEPWDRGHA